MAGFPRAGDVYGGRYRIVREIGHGGMGSVYEALDTVLDRAVALKVVLPSLPDREQYHARFGREAAVLARIKSRHVVGIYDYGEHDDTVFLATQLFPDGDLRTWLSRHGPLDRRGALSLAAQVCEALADAHAEGVVHRDVKPGNVLVWSRPEGLLPYLCDFGIAVDGQAEGRAGLTRTGTLIGSPAYMAPERHFGHPADERGDVYSTGCLLWAALVGEAPYSGTDFQMMNAHINAPVPQLGTGDPVDDRIDEVLSRALDKDPERRTPSADTLRSALLGVLREIEATGDAPAPPPPPQRRPKPPPAAEHTVVRAPAPKPPARRWLVPAAAAAAVAVAVGVTTLAVSVGRSGPDPSSAPGADPGASSSRVAAPAPAPPTVSARPGYRSVTFAIAGAGATERTEYDAGDGWQPATGRTVEVLTTQGGERACITARTVGADPDTTSDEIRACGRARPRTVALVRTPGACTSEANGYTYPCQWYGVRVSGFASRTAPLARLRPADQDRWCVAYDECRRVRVTADGRGRIDRYFRILTDSGTWVLDVDGVRSRTRLYYR